MHKSWLHLIAANLLLVGMLAKLRVVIEKHIPLAYQGETGFQYGIQRPRGN